MGLNSNRDRRWKTAEICTGILYYGQGGSECERGAQWLCAAMETRWSERPGAPGGLRTKLEGVEGETLQIGKPGR